MKKRLKRLIKLGIYAAVTMCLINKWIEKSALARHLLKSSKEDYFEWSHGSVYYKKTGSGSPILLIHDLDPSSSSVEWNGMIDKLSELHTVYTIDLPGCGRSDKGKMTYVSYLYIQLLNEFTQKVIGEKTDVCATGSSGSFVLKAAQLNKDMFGRITLISPKAPDDAGETVDPVSDLTRIVLDIPVLGTFIYNIKTCRRNIYTEFAEKYYYNPFKFSNKLVDTYYEAAHRGSARGRHLLASIYGKYLSVDIKEAVSDPDLEICLIFGAESPDSEWTAEEYRELDPSLTCHFVPKTKVLPQLEAPDRILYLLEK